MHAENLPNPTKAGVDPWSRCLCGRRHPCPYHGPWARPVEHEQLQLPVAHR